MAIPSDRLRAANDAPVNPAGDYVLYWMIAARRPRDSFALDHALEQARALRKPLLVFEPLRRGYWWAADRFHHFVHQGMRANQVAFGAAGVTYLPYIEPEDGDDKGLLAALARHAALVVTDRFPTYFLPRMVASAAAALPVRVDVVDGLGIVPLDATPRAFSVAHSFRRWVQKNVRPMLDTWPEEAPLRGYDLGPAVLPDLSRWPNAFGPEPPPSVGGPGPVARRGGFGEAEAVLASFLEQRLARYHDARNDPDESAASGLSPWLHFGHVGAHRVLRAVLDHDRWTPDELAPKATGKRAGWWGASPPVEAFLDEVLTWREVGHVFAHHVPDHDRYESLPAWALTTLDDHRYDPRQVYTLDALDQARTDDEVWNAAQRELVRSGTMHNYLRMLWGKKVLQWSPSPEVALARLIELNNRYALDGRDPNSTSGIFWVFGRFDRAWGPERPIFGKVRYMTSASTRRKLRLANYLARWAA